MLAAKATDCWFQFIGSSAAHLFEETKIELIQKLKKQKLKKQKLIVSS